MRNFRLGFTSICPILVGSIPYNLWLMIVAVALALALISTVVDTCHCCIICYNVALFLA